MNIPEAYHKKLIVVGRHIETNGDGAFSILRTTTSWNGANCIRGIITAVKKDCFLIKGNYYRDKEKLLDIDNYFIEYTNSNAYIKFLDRNRKKISCFAYWILKNKL